MILDCHCHARMGREGKDSPAVFFKKLTAAGIDGGAIFSEPPRAFAHDQPADHPSPEARLADVFRWTEASELLFPFFWIDPTEPTATAQVSAAVEAGIMGFKIITNRYLPSVPSAMDTYQAIADTGKPILFHSGILWDGQPSSINTQPAGFECLLTIKGLRFALAHISWPWTDECIAVYGKFRNALQWRKDINVEMFIDVSPGTPPIYREDALRTLFGVGYALEGNVMFGADSNTATYSVEWAKEWIQRDREIYDRLGLSAETQENIFANNLLRFIGNG